MKTSSLLVAAALVVAFVAFVAWRTLRASPVVDPAANAGAASSAAAPGEGPATPFSAGPPGVAVVRRTPFRDVESESGDAPPSLLDLTLLGDDGVALDGAAAFLLRGGAVIVEETADETGRVRFNADDDDAVFVALATGYAPFQGVVALKRGSASARQTPGAALAGTVTLDGVPAPADFPLEFQVDTPFPGTADLPPLGAPPRRTDVVRARVRSGGAFRIGGLAPDAAGRLKWPPEYELDDPASPRALVVTRPAGEIRVALRRAPPLVGRVLLADGVTPAAKTAVVVRIAWGMLAQDFATETDADGRFRAALAKCPSSGAPPVGVVVRVAGPTTPVALELACAGPFDAPRDVGDLVMPAEAVAATVRLVDERGAPAAGGVVVDEHGNATAAGVDGRAEVYAHQEYVAAAPGRMRKRFRAAETSDGVVALVAAGSAEIRVRTPAGKAAEGVFVVVVGKGLLAGGPPDAAYRAVAGGEVVAAAKDGARERVVFRPDAEGRVFVPEAALDGDVEIVVAESEAADAPVLDRTILRLAGGVVGRATLVAAR